MHSFNIIHSTDIFELLLYTGHDVFAWTRILLYLVCLQTSSIVTTLMLWHLEAEL